MVTFVYIVRCSDDTLYTGITIDIETRVDAHNRLRSGAKYTRTRRPVMLVYSETHPDLRSAMRREHAIKRMDRAQKDRLISRKS